MHPQIKIAIVCIGVAAVFGAVFGRSDADRLATSRIDARPFITTGHQFP